MRKVLKIALGLASALLMGATPAGAGQTSLGMSVAYQPWTPSSDNDTPVFLFRKPTVFSDAFNIAWQVGAPIASKKLVDILQTPDLAMKGVTFYNVRLHLNQPTVTFGALKCASLYNTPCTMDVRIDLKDEGLQLTSTTPRAPTGVGALVGGIGAGLATGGLAGGAAVGEALGHGLSRSADPTCSGAVSTTLHIMVKIQGAAGVPIFSIVPATANDPPPVVNGPSITGMNTSCQIVVDALSVSGLDDKIADMLNDPRSGAGATLRDTVQSALAAAFSTVSNVLSPGIAAVSNRDYPLQAVTAWIVPAGGGQQLVVDFAPRGPFYDRPGTAGTGQLSGIVNVSAPSGAPTAGGNGAIYCDQIPVTVTRKTGPRPMLTPDGSDLGDAPLETLAPRLSCSPNDMLLPGQTGHYTVSSISPLFPQFVTFGAVNGNCSSGSGLNVAHGTKIVTSWTATDPLLARDVARNPSIGAQLYSVACGSIAQVFADPRRRFDRNFDGVDQAASPVTAAGRNWNAVQAPAQTAATGAGSARLRAGMQRGEFQTQVQSTANANSTLH